MSLTSVLRCKFIKYFCKKYSRTIYFFIILILQYNIRCKHLQKCLSPTLMTPCTSQTAS